MQVSFIISVYKDTTSLKIVLDGLSRQTYQDFEIIVTEDGQCAEMADFFNASPYNGTQSIQHLVQEDIGWRKNRALNQAVRVAKGEYLVFIDGDCVPHSRFVESHARLAEPNRVVSGSRVMLGPKISTSVKSGRMTMAQLEEHYYRKFISLALDGGRLLEEGVYLDPNGLLGRFSGKRVRDILGCNFSCFRKDMQAINGFDEDYLYPRGGEDNDVCWRLDKIGVKLKSARNIAIQYHLDHGRSHYSEVNHSMIMLNEKRRVGKTFCENGLQKIDNERQSAIR